MAHFSIVIVSHNKPDVVKESIQSVLDQTHQDWEAVLIDSGVLLKQGFFDYIKDKRIRVMHSGEEPDTHKKYLMPCWCLNRALNSGELTGELIMYLSDDDLLYKDAFETFWNYYIEHNREPQAMYASQDIGLVDRQGKTKIIGKRIADRPAGRFCKGRKLDCQVDYLQFCHTQAILGKMKEVYKTTLYHSEDLRDYYHADGIFMERVGAITKVHNINKLICMNRRTVDSVHLEYSESLLGRYVIFFKEKLRGLRLRLFPSRR